MMYHGILAVLEDAAAHTTSGWVCVPVPLAPGGRLGWAESWGLGGLRHRAFVFRRHLDMVRRVWRHAMAGRPVLVREFSTLPLWAVEPLLQQWRDRVWFLVNHNVQWALRERLERMAFRSLCGRGVRFVFFETTEVPFVDPEARERSAVLLRFPVRRARVDTGSAAAERPWIGLAGHFRREKGMLEALRVLAAQPDLRGRLAVGVPNPVDFRRQAEFCDLHGIPVINTSGESDYLAFLQRCAVVVLNYSADSYAWRPSGLMADCATAGAAVVIPDLPVQRIQLTWPAPVGETYRLMEELPAVIRRAERRAREGAYDFSAYCRERSAEALARRLDEIWRGHSE